MRNVQDIHTHNLPIDKGSAIVCIGLESSMLSEGHFFSAGLHPWIVTGNDEDSFLLLDSLLYRHDIVALGECGLDSVRGPSLDIQEKAFIRQFELSEFHSKPMLLHVVRSFDRIISLKKSLKPAQKWLIHGFRGGPEQARQLLGCGFYLSFGLYARVDTIRALPESSILAESDGKCEISEVIERISHALGVDEFVAKSLIESNISDFFT